MPGKLKRMLREGAAGSSLNWIKTSMGLKFMVALTGVIFALLVLGAFIVMPLVTMRQNQALEARGAEIGQFLGTAAADPLLRLDIATINRLVANTVKAQDMLYAYVEDSTNKVLSTVYVSFNRSDANVKDFLDQEQSEDVAVLAAKAKDRFDAIEIQSEIQSSGVHIGVIKMGLSRTGVRKAALQTLMVLVGICVLIYCGLAPMIYVMVRKMIVGPTTKALAVASNIAAGDLSQSVAVRTVDEIGMLGQGLNRMIIGLKGMIENVREASRKTEAVWTELHGISTEITSGSKAQAESVEEAASSVNEMHFSLKEIAGNVEDLYKTSEQTSSSVIEMAASVGEVARTMTELSSSIEDTATAITQLSAAARQIAENVEVLSTAADETAASTMEISASVKEVESNASESAALAEAVAADAEQLGMRSIEKTIEGMNGIEATARRTAEVINRLGERAENIGSILTVIEDITDQTGLLALNAAILAAQAGEHGKGFAVVAAEIRGLANRTASSTQEIGKLITSVQEESREAVEVMREEVSMVSEGVRLASAAGDALGKILARADQSRDMSRNISKAATEQAVGIKQVSEAVGKITEMTHQIALAANEQKLGSEQITRASEKMRELTRFVKTSTDEQATGSKAITASVENISSRIGMVNKAAGEVQTGSDLIVKAIERIKEIARANADQAVGLDNAMDVMFKQTTTLKTEIEKFRVENTEAGVEGQET